MSTTAWTTPAHESIAHLVGMRAGLTLALRWESAEAGIQRAMERAGVRDLAAYRDLIDRDGDAFDDLMVELTVGETYFFREAGQFAAIRRTIVPDILARRGPTHRVRCWSAGCASGEEPYSLAMTLAACRVDASVLATDISRAALTLARAGVYSAWSLRADGMNALPHLDDTAAGFVVTEPIRRMVTFEQLNLALDVYPAFATRTWGLDLILCRNVFIYLDRATVSAVARRMSASLADGGWLLTSASDPPIRAEGLETVVTDAGILYRRKDRRPTAMAVPALTVAIPHVAGAPTSGPAPSSRPDVPATHERAHAAPALRLDAAASSSLAVDIRALANVDIVRAEQVCGEANAKHPDSPELRHLWALLLVELGRDHDAAHEARRALFLDRSLAVAHFTLGAILHRHGDEEGARRAYRQARDLCAARPADEPVPLGDGERCGRLAEAAETHMALLGAARVRA